MLADGYTSWPSPLGVAASFNTTLFEALGKLTSDEARAGATVGSTYWAPNINNFRDPRWGRGLETPGEDPTLTSNYAVHFVRGMQGTDATWLKTSACLKHLDAYSVETDRMEFSAVVTQQDMADTFEVPFKAG